MAFPPGTSTQAVGTVLKKFFLELPEPLIRENSIPVIEGYILSFFSLTYTGMVLSLPGLLNTLSASSHELVNYFLQFLKVVAPRTQELRSLSLHIGTAVAHLLTQTFGPETDQIAQALSRFFTRASQTNVALVCLCFFFV